MKSYKELYQRRELNVWLDITTYCNSACPQCHRTNPNGLGKVDWLPLIQWSLADFKKAFPLKSLGYIKKINFCGTWGDPIMNKDILEICKYIVDNSDCFIIINTNGSIRDIFWWGRLGLIIKDRGKVVFDVDGTTQEMHSHYRQNTNLNTILKNMKAYSQFGFVNVFTIVYKHNEDHLKDISKMINDIVPVDNHQFVPSDRAHHISIFKFYKDGELKILEHSPKYGKSEQRTKFTL
jgi:MoaA/NifB/PqqE/SkfB family radical SAM enzyme|tara:strand:+ start:246 stop:953 length:708 start_codon:yes stop_codon:yes gene_type:complete